MKPIILWLSVTLLHWFVPMTGAKSRPNDVPDKGRVPAAGEWDYFQFETFAKLSGMMLAFSVLLFFVNSHREIDFQVNLSAVVQVAWAFAAYGLFRFHPRLGLASLAAATIVQMISFLIWWPAPVAIILIPVPVLIISATLGAAPALLAAIITIAVLLYPAFLQSPRITAAQRAAAVLVVGLGFVTGYLQQRRYTSLLQNLLTAYRKANTQLEIARDHRLALNQMNHELAEAYVQLQRLNKLYQASRLEAEMARRAKEEFVANVSHELRTPAEHDYRLQ